MTRAGARVVATIAAVPASSVVGLAMSANTTSAALLLLLAVTVTALRGRVAGMAAAAAGFLALNYFFTAPRHTFAVAKGDDLVALLVFLVVAVLVGTLVGRATALQRQAERLEREARIRIELTRRLGAGDDPADVVSAAAHALADLYGLAECVLQVRGYQGRAMQAVDPGASSHIESGPGRADVVEGRARALGPDDRAVIEAMLVGLATALERLRLEAEARDARIAAAVGRTRSGFLSAVSHNLRTPLAAIRASVSTLLAPDAELDRAARRDLLDTIYEETDRLERLVSKVLDLSRIRAGGLEVVRQPVDIADLARAAVRRLRPLARAHSVRIDVPLDLPDVALDVTMMEQVFMNLLENALRYAPPGSEIRLQARSVAGELEVRVIDRGPGVALEDRGRIFEEFARADLRPEAAGAGLGLAIVRSMIEAHGGRVSCEDTPGGGATFVIAVPERERV